MRPIFYCLLFTALCLLFPPPARATIEQCIDATCRITAGAGRERNSGTGCVFAIKRDHIFLLTAGHVVEGSDTVQCEFWRKGHKSVPIAARVIARSPEADSAILAIPNSSLAGWLPTAVPIAPKGLVLRRGEAVTSVGCANGAWPTGWKGHVLEFSATEMYFTPTPADGRSGSAVFDAEGQYIVGLLKARRKEKGNESEGNYGIATYLPALYQAFEHKVQCPDGACPGGVCPSGDAQWLPWRREQEKKQQQPPQYAPQQYAPQQQYSPQQGGIWPSMPSTPPAAAPQPPVNLDPLQKSLEDISAGQKELIELLKQLKTPEPLPVGPLAPLPPVADIDEKKLTDEAAQKATEAVKLETAAIKAETVQATETLKEEVADAKAETSRLAGLVAALKDRVADVDIGGLKESFDARLEKISQDLPDDAGLREKVKAYAKDLVVEKVGEAASSGTSSLTMGKILAGSLGLSGPVGLGLGLGLMALRRRVKTRLAKTDSGELVEEVA
jgi:hypothetical protein